MEDTVQNYAALAETVVRRRIVGAEGPTYDCDCGFRHVLGYGHAPDELVVPRHGTLRWPCVCRVPVLRPCAERGCVVWTWWISEATRDETWWWQHGEHPEAVLSLPARMKRAELRAQVVDWFARCHAYEDALGVPRSVFGIEEPADPHIPSPHATLPDYGADVIAYMVWTMTCRSARTRRTAT